MATIPTTSPGQTLAGLAGVGHKALHDAAAAEVNLPITGRSAAAQGTTDPTISSGTTAAFANPTKTIMTQAGSDVYLFTWLAISTNGGDQIFLRARVDGGAWNFIGNINPNAAVGRAALFGMVRFPALSAGSHLFEIGWDNIGAGVTATSVGIARNMLVLEVHK